MEQEGFCKILVETDEEKRIRIAARLRKRNAMEKADPAHKELIYMDGERD